ncbi:MAG TPA: UDP-N-acetylglucosamine 2-epimerase, partial [Acidimicrobiales bacterium]|nr:UDP-N-acetylglucosamine 2-epimerase [Acidimicrobiales bacterium]
LDTLSEYGLLGSGYALTTIHRPENTDDASALRAILESLVELQASGTRVLFPIHPRTRLAVKGANCEALLEQLETTEPMGAREFLSLAAHASVIVSDSGGVAEEVSVLKRPLIIVRRSTERAESIDAGFARLVGPFEVGAAIRDVLSDQKLLARLANTPSPYGDGRSARRIAELTQNLIFTRSYQHVYA